MALSALQERVAALVAGLPEARPFALAGGGGLAAHGLLDRLTRDLDYFASPDDYQAVGRLGDSLERACVRQGLTVSREREAGAFVRLVVADTHDACAVDIAIDNRALDPVPTRYGPALDLRELGANKVLAMFDRAAPRDFLDLAELTKHVQLSELLALAADKDPGLDLDLVDHAMGQVRRIPADRLGLDEHGYRVLLDTVHSWQTLIRQSREPSSGRHGPEQDH